MTKNRPPFPALLAALLVAGAGLLSAGAGAAEQFGDWATVTEKEGKAKVCFAVAAPQKSEGDYTKRGEVFLIVTHRPAENSIGVVSLQTGYDYKPRAEVTVRIGAKTFRLFTEGENAWARDEATDRALVGAMKTGDNLVVKGTSARGTDTTDTFSLSGFTAAYRAISKDCNVK